MPIFSTEAQAFMRKNGGLTSHGVFSQWVFTVMRQDVALVFTDGNGQTRWIPCINEDGHVGSEVYGRFWSYWWLNAIPNYGGQREQWARVAEDWAKRNDVALEKGYVTVKVKPLAARHQWERDRQLALERAPWVDQTKIRWVQGRPRYEAP